MELSNSGQEIDLTTETTLLVDKSQDLSITEDWKPHCTTTAFSQDALPAILTAQNKKIPGGTEQEPPSLQQLQQPDPFQPTKSRGVPNRSLLLCNSFSSPDPFQPTKSRGVPNRSLLLFNSFSSPEPFLPTISRGVPNRKPTLQQHSNNTSTQQPCTIYDNPPHHHLQPPGTLITDNHPLQEQNETVRNSTEIENAPVSTHNTYPTRQIRD